MNISVAYGKAARQVWLKLEVPDGSTVRQAIELSGITGMFPEIDLDTQKVGIFGKQVKMEKVLSPGERVEIYRPITADPDLVERVAMGDG